ncbi:MAG: SDR family oxidoreductase [Myxococcales bacterium]|nr:SDR family oxidoreductase [Myxococcales bacterium]
MRVLVTGAAGYLGRGLVRALATGPDRPAALIAMDVRATPDTERLGGVTYDTVDIRDPGLGARIAAHRPEVVVHLASIVTPPRGCTRAEQYEVDVQGTERVLAACLASGVGRLIVTSSGAAYGYHADNAAFLTEDMPLRGHPDFAYADHKRQVEELLAQARLDHPELGQLVLRLGAVLGADTHNQITDLFDQPVIVGVAEAASPFNFIWDQDVVRCLAAAVRGTAVGVYNLAGDGVMTLAEIAAALGKAYVPVPAHLIGRALEVLHHKGWSQYGPEQVAFLRYRPVMSNQRLARELGFSPSKSSREVLELYRDGAGQQRSASPSRQRAATLAARFLPRAARLLDRGLTAVGQ